MIEYIILGTSHDIQDTAALWGALQEAIQKDGVKLIAEEFPFDVKSQAHAVSKWLGIGYLQIDLYPQEWAARGVEKEMKLRSECPQLLNQDIRLSHADSIREDFWLEKIENSVQDGRVLIVCGYLHVAFLAEKIRERGHEVLEARMFPPALIGRRPDKIFTLQELESACSRENRRGEVQ